MHFQLRYPKGFTLLFCCLIYNTHIVLGQSKQALQNYEAGINALNKNDVQNAIQFFTVAAAKDSQYLDPAIALFQVYHDQKDFQKAIHYFNTIKKIDSLAAIPFLVKQGIALASLGMYDAGYILLTPYISKNSLPNYLKEKANALYAVCQFASAQKMAPEINIHNMGDSINSPASEYFPTVSIQDSLFLFMRRLNLSREDFYTSIMGVDGFSAAIPLSDTLNFAAKKGSMSLSADLQTLYYAADYAEQGYGRYDIYKVQRSSWGWSKPKNLGHNINSDFWESAPSIAPDGNAIYFASNRPGGYGGIDIYVAYKNEKGYWEEAINLGPSINTKGDDQTPFIHADNQSLYFSSNGRSGFGGSDIYVARKKIDGNWTTPINLGYPINTEGNENSISVSANGKFGIIATQNTSDKNNLDLFQFQTYPAIRPINTHCIKGRVYDKKLNAGLNGYEVQLLDTNRNLVKTIKSNDGDATFAFAMLDNQFYTVIVNENDGSKEFTTTIDLRKPNMPTNIWLPIPLKIQGQKDTLYSFSFHHNSWQDTSQGYMKAMYPQWTRYPDDSVHFEAIIVHNIYIDTSFTRTVCFSDSGYADYLNYVNAILAAKRLEFKTYFEWYKKYLLYIGFPEENIHLYFEEAAWKDDRLYAIDLNVIEHY
jgi:hypothetical protein